MMQNQDHPNRSSSSWPEKFIPLSEKLFCKMSNHEKPLNCNGIRNQGKPLQHGLSLVKLQFQV
jgi:hypothetical protein